MNRLTLASSMKLPLLLANLACLVLCGCQSVRDSEPFYTPTTLDTYPPKPKDYNIPILGTIPDRPYKVIGRITFSSGYGQKFMVECLEYNARRVGADAVVLANSNTTAQQYNYTVPGYTTEQPVTTYGSATANYYGSGGTYGYGSATGVSTTYVPIYHEGFTGTGTVFRTNMDAFMVVFTSQSSDTHRRGAMGVFYDHGKVIGFAPRSKAPDAGLKPGDQVVSADGIPYNDPAMSAIKLHTASLGGGPEVTVQITRDGVPHTISREA